MSIFFSIFPSRCKTITHCVTIKTYLAHRGVERCVNCFVTLSQCGSMHFSSNWHVYTTNIGWKCTTETWIYCFSSTLLNALLLFIFCYSLWFRFVSFNFNLFFPLSFTHVCCPLSFQLSYFESTKCFVIEAFLCISCIKKRQIVGMNVCSFIQNSMFVFYVFALNRNAIRYRLLLLSFFCVSDLKVISMVF